MLADESGIGREQPDIAAAFTLLRLVNSDDREGAYQLASQWPPEELVVALVQAHLGSLRAGASRELDALLFSAEVTERVDHLLCNAVEICQRAAHRDESAGTWQVSPPRFS